MHRRSRSCIVPPIPTAVVVGQRPGADHARNRPVCVRSLDAGTPQTDSAAATDGRATDKRRTRLGFRGDSPAAVHDAVAAAAVTPGGSYTRPRRSLLINYHYRTHSHHSPPPPPRSPRSPPALAHSSNPPNPRNPPNPFNPSYPPYPAALTTTTHTTTHSHPQHPPSSPRRPAAAPHENHLDELLTGILDSAPTPTTVTDSPTAPPPTVWVVPTTSSPRRSHPAVPLSGGQSASPTTAPTRSPAPTPTAPPPSHSPTSTRAPTHQASPTSVTQGPMMNLIGCVATSPPARLLG